MKTLNSFIILLITLLTLVHFSTQESAPFNETEKASIIADHNYFRTQLSRGLVRGQPQAADMTLMTWDDELETLAQGWADHCNFDHNAQANRKTTDCPYCGENLWAVGVETHATNFTTSWFGEHVDYTYVSGTCAFGKMCGHYTQVAWAISNKIGCGRALCPSSGTWYKTIVVCNYCPGGNWLGEKPYKAGVPKTML